MKQSATARIKRRASFEVCILAGGLSTRMGCDKARLKLGRRSMLAIIRATAGQLRLPVRTIRRDVVPRCGPLGGILTGLKTARAQAVLFLACDMPLISPTLLERLLRLSGKGARPVVAGHRTRVGFPVLLPTSTLAVVEEQIERRCFSIRELAAAVRVRKVRVASQSRDLFNVNTPADRSTAERLLRQRQSRATK